jgi:hypothetical protein
MVPSPLLPQPMLSFMPEPPSAAPSSADELRQEDIPESTIVKPFLQPEAFRPSRVIVLTPEERRARAIALRGLAQSRAGRYDAAGASFLEAVTMDPALDLAKMPDFWRLSQETHQAAIEAYECAGRIRDAAELTAAVRTMFQPKLIRPRRVA